MSRACSVNAVDHIPRIVGLKLEHLFQVPGLNQLLCQDKGAGHVSFR